MKDLVIQWQNDIKDWCHFNSKQKIVPDPFDSNGRKFIKNIATKDISDLEYIVVGDNPGKTEFDKQYYFAGRTQYIIEILIDALKQWPERWPERVLFLNKSFISTPRTKDLRKSQQDQEIMANFITNICNKNPKIKLWVLGKEFKKFSYFWAVIQKKLNDKSNLFVFGHPSNNWFCVDFMRAMQEACSKTEFEKLIGYFHDFGKKQAENLIKNTK